MASERKTPTKSTAVRRGVDALAELLRERAGRRRRGELVLTDRTSLIAENELIVLVVGKHNAVARTVRRPQGQVDLRDLHLGAQGAALAVEEVGPRRPERTRAPLSPQEAQLLVDGGFDEPTLDAKLASDDGTLEYLRLLHDSLSPEEAANLLGVNASRVRQRLGERRLFGVKDGRAWRLPMFQFVEDRLVPGIDVALASLPQDLHPVAVHRWFRSPHPDLEPETGVPLTPLEWLIQGLEPARIAELASLL